MGLHISRRSLLGSTAAGVAVNTLAGERVGFAQDDDKPEITLGSANYTEAFILGEITGLLLEEAGYPVNYQHNLGGTMVLHEARVAGDIDLHIIYIGDGLIILEKEHTDLVEEDASPEEIRDASYEFVRDGYLEEWNHHWLEPIGINNSYAIAMRRADAEELGITKISDLEPHAGGFNLAGSQEFMIRPDGLPGMQEAYGFEFADARGMDQGLLYSALENGDVDVISATATDGRVPALDFVFVEDDIGFFPPYHASPVVRGELLEESPDVEDMLNQMGGLLDNTKMAELNFRVDDGGEEPRDVARDFLTEEGLIEGNGDE